MEIVVQSAFNTSTVVFHHLILVVVQPISCLVLMLRTVVRFVAKQICETEDMDSFHEFSEFGDKV